MEANKIGGITNQGEYKSAIRSFCGKLKNEISLRDTELELRIEQSRIYIIRNLWMFTKERLTKSNSYPLGGGTEVEYEDLPSDFIEDLRVIVNEYKAFKINYEDFASIDDNYYYAPSATNPVYFIKGNTVGMYPTTNGTTAELLYIAKPTAFSDDTTDESELALYIPAEFQELVVQKVCEELSARPDISCIFSLSVDAKIENMLGKKQKDQKDVT